MRAGLHTVRVASPGRRGQAAVGALTMCFTLSHVNNFGVRSIGRDVSDQS
jgi:hypothetical protein